MAFQNRTGNPGLSNELKSVGRVTGITVSEQSAKFIKFKIPRVMIKNTPSTSNEAESDKTDKVGHIENPILRILSNFRFAIPSSHKPFMPKRIIETLKKPAAELLKKPTGRTSIEKRQIEHNSNEFVARPVQSLHRSLRLGQSSSLTQAQRNQTRLVKEPDSSSGSSLLKKPKPSNTLKRIDHLLSSNAGFKFKSMNSKTSHLSDFWQPNTDKKRPSVRDDKGLFDPNNVLHSNQPTEVVVNSFKVRTESDSEESSEQHKDHLKGSLVKDKGDTKGSYLGDRLNGKQTQLSFKKHPNASKTNPVFTVFKRANMTFKSNVIYKRQIESIVWKKSSHQGPKKGVTDCLTDKVNARLFHKKRDLQVLQKGGSCD
jgi:hypothetical protein